MGIFLNYGVGESFPRHTIIPGYTDISDVRIPFNIVDYGPLASAGIMIETAKKKTIMIDLRYQLGTKFSAASKVNYFT